MSVMINLLGLLLIGFIVWWFWLARSGEAKTVTNTVDVIVADGVYSPAAIEVKQGETVKLNFIRRDASPCAEKVIFADLGVSAELPINQTRQVEITPQQRGEFEFTCQMGMYRGKLIVK